jgi:hypothetical protein
MFESVDRASRWYCTFLPQQSVAYLLSLIFESVAYRILSFWVQVPSASLSVGAKFAFLLLFFTLCCAGGALVYKLLRCETRSSRLVWVLPAGVFLVLIIRDLAQFSEPQVMSDYFSIGAPNEQGIGGALFLYPALGCFAYAVGLWMMARRGMPIGIGHE